MVRFGTFVLATLAAFAAARPCAAFVTNGRWSVTATDGPTAPAGSPVTVTWSIAPNGTSVPGYGGSSLISFFDNLFGAGPGGADLEQRPWFPHVRQSFDRWSELGGITFVYEPADDGLALNNFAGALNVRGDIRLAGVNIDGPGGAAAQAAFLDLADITIDTSDGDYLDDVPANGFRILRNTLMHETGHALGLAHSDSLSAAFLMESPTDNNHDGPQYDDVRGLHQLYGDRFEKNGGNGSASLATDLGAIAIGQTMSLGNDGISGAQIASDKVDFLSIANLNDVDFFSFTLAEPALMTLVANPVGPNYSERVGASYPITRSSRASDLALSLYAVVDGAPVLLTSSDTAPLGQPEVVSGLPLAEPGEYLVRVTGSTNVVQTYQLSVGAAAGAAGDFDLNQVVDGRDFLAWQRGFGGAFDDGDFDDWQAAFGSNAAAASRQIPEPGAYALALAGTAFLARRRNSARPSR